MGRPNDWLGTRESLSPDRTALVDEAGGRGAITYRQWNRAANRTAAFLRERLGVRQGDRVAVLAMNCVEVLDVWFACGKLGAIFQPLNWRLASPELARLLEDAGPVALIYGPDFLAQVEAVRPQASSVRHFVALDGARRVREEDLPFAAREELPDSPPPAVEVSWDDPWVLCYTGGTTGVPKGAMLTYRSITTNAANTVVGWGLTAGDTAILDAPLFHTGGLNVFTAPLVYVGGRSVVCRSFSADKVLELVGRGELTLLFGVPTMFIALQGHARWSEVDFSRLKLVITGGAPCPQRVFEQFWAQGVDFRGGYGLTEAGPNNFAMPASDVRRKPGSVGFPLFHVETRIVGDGGRPCGPDEVGELLIRGPHVCGGYWKRPEETARTIVDGWLHTGDLARVDAEGYCYIVGRKKEMIISGGENVYPAEVEGVLASHPSVEEAVLIGVPDAQWGEVGRALVARRSGAPAVTAEELTEFCRQRLARYKVPRSFVLLDSLPKTAAGKLDRRELTQKYGEAPNTGR